jgi:hypothetical protein
MYPPEVGGRLARSRALVFILLRRRCRAAPFGDRMVSRNRFEQLLFAVSGVENSTKLCFGLFRQLSGFGERTGDAASDRDCD